MQETLEHWKEGAGILLYFGFLAFFTPKAEAMGWGYKGILFSVLAGGLCVFLLYLAVKFSMDYIARHREEVKSFREYMGIASPERYALSTIGASGMAASSDELDALLATNPYATPEVFADDRYTHLLPRIEVQDADTDPETLAQRQPVSRAFASGAAQDARETQAEAHPEQVSSLIGENPRRRLILAPNFQPDADDPLATGVFFVGIPGSGKTVALALFLEQYITRYRLATVIFDTEGDLRSIVEDGLCPRGLIATPDTLPSMEMVVRHRMQVVIDLQQCRRPGESFINYELAAQLIARTLKELMNAQSAIAPDLRLPCLVGLDETHVWGPQQTPSYLEPRTAKDVLDTLTVIATRGRKYGVVPFLACQRIPKVHKDIIAGCETRILGKADLDNDITRYRDYVSKEVISDQGIRQLGKGRMVVCMNGQRLLVQFNNRTSRHTSHTPGVGGALDSLVGDIPEELLASMTRPAVIQQPLPLPVRQSGADTRRLSPETGEVRATHTTELASELQSALAMYRPGMSYRELGRAMHLSDGEARTLFQLLKQRGLLNTGRGGERCTATAENPVLTPELQMALNAYVPGMSHRELGQELGVSHVTAGKYIQRLKDMQVIDVNGVVSGKW